MPEINHKEFSRQLARRDAATFDEAAVYLLYGDEFLYKQILEKLLPSLLSDDDKDLNHVPLMGTNENIPKALAELNTYSLIPGKKVVVLTDAKVFHSKENRGKLLEKAQEAAAADKLKRAAQYFMGYLAFSEMELEDLDLPGQRRKLEAQLDGDGSHAWIDQLIAYCREKRLSPPTDQDASDDLLQAIRKGFPKGHHLIITTELVDKRKKLFKTIREDGISVDCSTPKGERRADRMAQEAILREHMESALAGRGKTMDAKAFHAASNMTGFDLRNFSGNLEKLMDYVGERKRIGIEDVQAVLKRTKSDPIFEFTNALVARDLKKALFFLNSLLTQNFAALQLLAAMINQIRKLLVARDFLDGPRGNTWSPGISFNQFKASIMPLMQAQDQDHQEMLSSWEAALAPPLEGEDPQRGKGKRKKAKQKKEASDLLLVKNPRSPYPVFLLLQKADGFSRDELLGTLVELSRADRMLKSSPVDPKIVLEKLLFAICSPQSGKRKGGR